MLFKYINIKYININYIIKKILHIKLIYMNHNPFIIDGYTYLIR